MKIVICSALERYELEPASAARERTGRRSITFSPDGGATVILRPRAALGERAPQLATVA